MMTAGTLMRFYKWLDQFNDVSGRFVFDNVEDLIFYYDQVPDAEKILNQISESLFSRALEFMRSVGIQPSREFIAAMREREALSKDERSFYGRQSNAVASA